MDRIRIIDHLILSQMILQNFYEVQNLNRDFEIAQGISPAIQNFTVGNQICIANKSKFYRVTNGPTKKQFTLKVSSKSKIASNKAQVDKLLRELSIMLNCPPHQNIMHIEAVFEDKAQIYVLLEPVDMSLATLMKAGSKVTEKDCRVYMRGLFKVLSLLHSLDPPVVHRNLKPENIFIQNNDIKIFGFEIAASAEEFRNTICGSSNYISPEMVTNAGYDEKIDIWSAGVLMYEMLNGKHPFLSQTEINSVDNFPFFYEKAVQNISLTYDQNVSSEARALIERLLNVVPFKRPSAKETLESDFFHQKHLKISSSGDSAYTNLDMVPSLKKLDESLDWSVTQSYAVPKNLRNDFGEAIDHERSSPKDNVFNAEINTRSKFSYNTFQNNFKMTEKNPFEILLEQHHKIVC